MLIAALIAHASSHYKNVFKSNLLNNVCFESELHMHALELLEKQLASVRDVSCNNLGIKVLFIHIGTFKAREFLGLFVGYGLVATAFADENSVKVRDFEKSLFEELGCSMRDHTISFHFSES